MEHQLVKSRNELSELNQKSRDMLKIYLRRCMNGGAFSNKKEKKWMGRRRRQRQQQRNKPRAWLVGGKERELIKVYTRSTAGAPIGDTVNWN